MFSDEVEDEVEIKIEMKSLTLYKNEDRYGELGRYLFTSYTAGWPGSTWEVQAKGVM